MVGFRFRFNSSLFFTRPLDSRDDVSLAPPSSAIAPCCPRLQPIAKSCPMYVSGSADLHGSNKNYIDNGGDFGVNLGKRCVLFVSCLDTCLRDKVCFWQPVPLLIRQQIWPGRIGWFDSTVTVGRQPHLRSVQSIVCFRCCAIVFGEMKFGRFSERCCCTTHEP